MRYTLNRITEIISGQAFNSNPQLQFSKFTTNSKEANADTFFLAIVGDKHDGHNFIDQALSNGCQLLIVNKKIETNQPYILVKDTRLAHSQLCADLFETAKNKIKIAGVTGTNGKSTLHWLIAQIVETQKNQALCIGTLGIRFANQLIDTGLTTPDTITIHQALNQAQKLGINYAAMEVSSHALDQSRVANLNFEVAVFTNLTQDHLDYHKTIENYYLAKQKLFDLCKNSAYRGLAVINTDDPFGQRLAEYTQKIDLQTATYGKNSKANYRILNYEQYGNSSSFEVAGPNFQIKINSPFIAEYNAYNLLGALISSEHLLNVPLPLLAEQSCNLKAVPGRLESLGNSEINIFVDYAHTPDALEKALLALKNNHIGKLWVVFGCGGDRDRTKRPIMGKIAETHADEVVVTSDNPRTENPDAIIEDITKELTRVTLKERDRKKAILFAIKSAKKGDTILIAGKGHEDYQIIGTEKFHFSDQEIVRDALNS